MHLQSFAIGDVVENRDYAHQFALFIHDRGSVGSHPNALCRKMRSHDKTFVFSRSSFFQNNLIWFLVLGEWSYAILLEKAVVLKQFSTRELLYIRASQLNCRAIDQNNRFVPINNNQPVAH